VCSLDVASYYCSQANTIPFYWLCLGCAERHRQWVPEHDLLPVGRVVEAARP
jgi:hypothetical protein